MKRIHVNAIIRQATGSRWNQSATREASSIAVGIKRCVQDLLGRQGVKGLHHTHLSLDVTITHVQDTSTRRLTSPSTPDA